MWRSFHPMATRKSSNRSSHRLNTGEAPIIFDEHDFLRLGNIPADRPDA